jgi:hypothetical protein
VDNYLAQVGQPLAAVREALQDDPTLWELLDTPLMLTVVTLAYASQPAETLHTWGTLAERRQSLLATYVDWMFQRRSGVTRYPRARTERWLAWLAWQLTQHSQTIFYLERLQPNWLPVGRRWLTTHSAQLLAGLVGLLAGLSAGLGSGLGPGLVGGLIYKLSTSLVAGLSGGEVTTKTVPNEGIRRSARMAVSTGIVSGLVIGLVGGLVGGPLAGLATGLKYGGRACLQHLVLRLSLRYDDCVPRRYVDFLDYAAERLFLRRVGGGYIFIHRLLQEYFAARYQPDRVDSPPRSSPPPPCLDSSAASGAIAHFCPSR